MKKLEIIIKQIYPQTGKEYKMLGAIIGDIVGSPYEFHNIKTKEFPLFCERSCFTDDTILTCATADWLMNEGDPADYLKKWGDMYADRTYENGTIAAFGGGRPDMAQAGGPDGSQIGSAINAIRDAI